MAWRCERIRKVLCSRRATSSGFFRTLCVVFGICSQWGAMAGRVELRMYTQHCTPAKNNYSTHHARNRCTFINNVVQPSFKCWNMVFLTISQSWFPRLGNFCNSALFRISAVPLAERSVAWGRCIALTSLFIAACSSYCPCCFLGGLLRFLPSPQSPFPLHSDKYCLQELTSSFNYPIRRCSYFHLQG